MATLTRKTIDLKKICLMCKENEFKDNNKSDLRLLMTVCNHLFHKGCLAKWYSLHQTNPTCPECEEKLALQDRVRPLTAPVEPQPQKRPVPKQSQQKTKKSSNRPKQKLRFNKEVVAELIRLEPNSELARRIRKEWIVNEDGSITIPKKNKPPSPINQQKTQQPSPIVTTSPTEVKNNTPVTPLKHRVNKTPNPINQQRPQPLFPVITTSPTEVKSNTPGTSLKHRVNRTPNLINQQKTQQPSTVTTSNPNKVKPITTPATSSKNQETENKTSKITTTFLKVAKVFLMVCGIALVFYFTGAYMFHAPKAVSIL